MGRLPPDLEGKRQRLLRVARRGAFDSYMRRGRVPEFYWRIATAVSEMKNLNAEVAQTRAGKTRPPNGRPTNHYTWRTAGDDRVRGSHAALNGRVFSWSSPPVHGHPGSEANCRCWAEPYYGDPAVPDAPSQLQPRHQVNTDPAVLWASIDTLMRPDGTLAASAIVMNDGTTINSSFVGSTVEHLVTLPGSGAVRVEKDGEARRSSVSTPDGQHWHMAQLRQLLFPPMPPPPPTAPSTAEPVSVPSSVVQGFPWIILFHAARSLFYMILQQPPSLGAGTADVPIVVYRVWQSEAGAAPVPVTETLTQEQVTQLCPRAVEVQSFIDLAAQQWAPLEHTMPKSALGTKIHVTAKALFDEAAFLNPALYANMHAEVSLDLQDPLDPEAIGVSYGTKGSTRLDIMELVNAGMGCVYDYKTGQAGLTTARILRIYEVWNKRFPGVPFVIIEMRQQSPVWSE